MKKINTLIVVLAILLSASGLKSQTYPVPKFMFHITGGYTLPLPDLKGTYPTDLKSGKNPTPYFMKSGFNFGVDAKYYIDKKSTFGVMVSLVYTMLNSSKIGTSDSTVGVGTWQSKMNIFTIGAGVEYDFAPKRPANPFVNVMFTTNIFGGNTEFISSGSDSSFPSYKSDLSSAVRFGAQFGAGVDVKLSKKIGVIIGGRYNFANFFGKDSTGGSSTSYGLNDKETTVEKAKKIPYLQFYAGISFYLGQKSKTVIKK